MMNYTTPIIPCIGMESNNRIDIKRDDLLPFSFGGNKVRIAEELFSDMEIQGKNCMIGYGSTRSNLCRVLANMCSSRRIKCHIISSEDNDGSLEDTNNSKLVKICAGGELRVQRVMLQRQLFLLWNIIERKD